MNVRVSDNASAQLILLVVTVLAGWVLNGSEHNVLFLRWLHGSIGYIGYSKIVVDIDVNLGGCFSLGGLTQMP